jgi:hypothetical protein
MPEYTLTILDASEKVVNTDVVLCPQKEMEKIACDKLNTFNGECVHVTWTRFDANDQRIAQEICIHRQAEIVRQSDDPALFECTAPIDRDRLAVSIERAHMQRIVMGRYELGQWPTRPAYYYLRVQQDTPSSAAYTVHTSQTFRGLKNIFQEIKNAHPSFFDVLLQAFSRVSEDKELSPELSHDELLQARENHPCSW